jgi:hypothetical protein
MRGSADAAPLSFCAKSPYQGINFYYLRLDSRSRWNWYKSFVDGKDLTPKMKYKSLAFNPLTAPKIAKFT